MRMDKWDSLRTLQNQAKSAARHPLSTPWSLAILRAAGLDKRRSPVPQKYSHTHSEHRHTHRRTHESSRTRSCWSRIGRWGWGRGPGGRRGRYLCGFRSRCRLLFSGWPRVVCECCDVILIINRNGHDGADLASNRANKFVLYKKCIQCALVINDFVAHLDALGSTFKQNFGDVSL